MAALFESKRKIGNFHAQSAARSMLMEAPRPESASACMPAAGLRVESLSRGSSFRDKAFDAESGESFYVGKKANGGNILMHDAMYNVKKDEVGFMCVCVCWRV